MVGYSNLINNKVAWFIKYQPHGGQIIHYLSKILKEVKKVVPHIKLINTSSSLNSIFTWIFRLKMFAFIWMHLIDTWHLCNSYQHLRVFKLISRFIIHINWIKHSGFSRYRLPSTSKIFLSRTTSLVLEHFYQIHRNIISSHFILNFYLEQKFRYRCNYFLPVSNFLLARSVIQVSYKVRCENTVESL